MNDKQRTAHAQKLARVQQIIPPEVADYSWVLPLWHAVFGHMRLGFGLMRLGFGLMRFGWTVEIKRNVCNKLISGRRETAGMENIQ